MSEVKTFNELPSAVINGVSAGRPKEACILAYNAGVRAGRAGDGDAKAKMPNLTDCIAVLGNSLRDRPVTSMELWEILKAIKFDVIAALTKETTNGK